MPRTLVIFNPTARSKRAADRARAIERLCTGAEVRTTSKPGDARRLAHAAALGGYERVVAAGGDGTLNEVVNGIAGSDTALGLLPIGTMNVFATEIGLPVSNLSKCWDVIQTGHTRPVDVATANGHHFIQLGGIGLDAQALQETSGDFKRNWGPLSYVINAAQIAARKPPQLRVRTSDGEITGSFVMIGNGRLYGGPFVLFKDASLDDGRLDLLVFKSLGYLDIVRYLQAILFGLHPDLPDVEYHQSAEIHVTSATPVPFEVDGDVLGTLPVTFRIAPKKLRVLAPAR